MRLESSATTRSPVIDSQGVSNSEARTLKRPSLATLMSSSSFFACPVIIGLGSIPLRCTAFLTLSWAFHSDLARVCFNLLCLRLAELKPRERAIEAFMRANQSHATNTAQHATLVSEKWALCRLSDTDF